MNAGSSPRESRAIARAVTRARHFGRLWDDDSGQDLVEYGLLAAIIGIVGVLVFPSIQTKMTNAFQNWGTNVYNLWVPDDPAGP
jgi:Flp pilus assembly pilin Flp